MKDYSISIYLDTRRKKANGSYPVKLRVYHSTIKKAKFFSTVFDFTEKEFESIWETVKPRKEYKELRKELQALETKAESLAKKITPFNLHEFEKKMYRKSGDGNNVYYQYEENIHRLKSNNQLGTASNYQLSLKSIKDFLQYDKGKEPKKLTFFEITPDWLNKYENYMLNIKGRSRTTVSMYLRALRTIFNNAIASKDIEADVYPFGKRKYQIPAAKGVKKALTREQLAKLFKAPPRTPEQAKAKDFWFFSYSCNGMNIKDIALLRYKDVQEGIITFYRAKTINTSKADLKPVTVHLTAFPKEVIRKYGNDSKNPNQFVFSIIEENMDEATKQNKIKNFTRFINQALKKLAKLEGLPEGISTYWARHSFATNAIRSGASMEFVSEALSHSNLKTTQGYFAGFEEVRKREIMDKIMTF